MMTSFLLKQCVRPAGLLLGVLLGACVSEPPPPVAVQPTEPLPPSPPPVRPPLPPPPPPRVWVQAAQTAPSNTVPGDLDGDGDLDLLSSTSAGLFLSRNRGDGTFDPPEFQATPELWYVHEFGDIDRDGDLDFVSMADLRQPQARLIQRTLLNDGTGRFSEGTKMDMFIPVLLYAQGISRLGEVDGDGALDVFTLHSGAERTRTYRETLTVWRTAGTGTLSVRTDLHAGPSPYLATAGDLSGDGRTDFALVVENPRRILIIDPKGFTGEPVSTRELGVSQDCYVSKLLLRDFDGDGDTDLAFACNGLTILFNDGRGKLMNPWSYSSKGYVRDFTAADVNRDGKLDLVVGDSVWGPSLFLGQGGGSFRFQASWATHMPSAPDDGFNSAGPVFVEDFNRDGHLDLLTATRSRQGTRALLLGDGRGGFIGPEMRLQERDSPVHGFIDVNRDGAEDLLLNGQILINAPAGVLKPVPTAFKSNGGAHILDLNGDGLSDVIGTNELWLGDGKTLVYGSAVKGAWGGGFTGRYDADNDGTPDLVFGGSFARGLGGGRFADTVLLPAAPETRIVGTTLFADFNGDGALDLHTPNVSRVECTPDFGCQYQPQGEGVCLWSLEQRHYACLEGNPPLTPLAALDLTGDGVVDLANDTQLARGLGDGRFDAPEPLPALSLLEQARLGMRPDLLLGDVDADGRTDVLRFRDHDWVDLMRGQEDGEPGPALTFFAPGFGWKPRLVDLDDDGLPELVRPAQSGFAVLKLMTR